MRAPAFWNQDGWPARALAPLGAAVDHVTTRRRRRTAADAPGVPVICVGNISLGGAGKTPVAMDLCARLVDAGWRAHVLTRGYGGRPGPTPRRVDADADTAARVGDEALLLARAAPTWVAPDRIAGARAAIADGAEVLVLDDGFQSARVRADLNVVVVDGAVGFGNRKVWPAGPLRERPETALARAHAVVRLGPDAMNLDREIAATSRLLTANIALDGDTHWLRGARVVAFAGIGRPGKLFDSLADAGAAVVAAVPFPDHYRYMDGDLRTLAARADAAGAHLVTTAKDHVRLPRALRDRVTPIPVKVVWDDAAAVTMLLSELDRHAER